MKIDNWEELECTYKLLADMVRLRDKFSKEPVWTPSQRATMVEGVEAQMRKMERDVQDFLASQPEVEKVALAV